VPPAPADHLPTLIERLLGTVHPARLLVASDFDGTLAEVVPDAGAARALPQALAALEALVGVVGAVALISGRAQPDLERVVDVPGLLLLGDYGQPAGGPPDPGLARFRRAVGPALAAIPGTRLEVKPGAVAIHYRERPEAGPAVLAAVAGPARAEGLDVRRGRMVVEVLPAGWDKSRALARLLEETAAGGAVFLGDDFGDRGCFEYLARQGRPHLAIGVASPETPAEVFAACDVVVAGPAGAAAALSRLARAARARGRAGP
jgi:trehalose 6-phosphate phosphatase